MRVLSGLIASVCVLLGPAPAVAQESVGAQEIAAAFDALERRCPAEVASAYALALAGISESAAEHGIQTPQTNTSEAGVLQAYDYVLSAAPSLNEAALARAAIDAIASALDGGDSGYLDFRPCNCTAAVGLELTESTPHHTVVFPLAGTPAEAAGVLSGDKIIAIDGSDVTGASLSDVVRMLRGAPGSEVAVTVTRDEERLTFEMRRAIITIRPVTWSLDDGIGVIAIKTFNERSADRVREAIRELRRSEPRGYIIDLRGNSGGLLDQAIETADHFLNGGVVVNVLSARQCPEEEPQTYHARRGDETRGARLIILTDGQTASGAEVVAAALVERGRAETVGQRTFGIGSVSTVVPLSDRAGMRLITGELATPRGGVFTGGRAPLHETAARTPESDPAMDHARALLSAD
ncbi:MAG TPA: S41 family peptidase [Vitreimonas sp.]|nr:S41 family peptidase [Vitreimonas sp.]